MIADVQDVQHQVAAAVAAVKLQVLSGILYHDDHDYRYYKSLEEIKIHKFLWILNGAVQVKCLNILKNSSFFSNKVYRWSLNRRVMILFSCYHHNSFSAYVAFFYLFLTFHCERYLSNVPLTDV